MSVPEANVTAESDVFCFGLGFSAGALARRLECDGTPVGGTTRTPAGVDRLAAAGHRAFLFDGAHGGDDVRAALAQATHVVVSIAPDSDGDPVLRHYAASLFNSTNIRWIGYLSTVGVYGDSGGAWIDEETPINPTSARTERRAVAEEAWLEAGRESGKRVEIFRLGGIYGPGRSVVDDIRDGTARRIIKAGQVFNRIYVEDIATVLAAAMSRAGAHTLFNVVDDEPAPPQDVISYAAGLLGVALPPAIAFEEADLSPMARSFYAANRRIRNRRIKEALGIALMAPTYREGIKAILAAEEAHTA